MIVKQADPEASTVTLVSPGKESQTVEFAEGSTLADLLKSHNLSSPEAAILIDGTELTEYIPLKTGMVITIVPQLGHATERDAWRETVGMFPDDGLFQEMVDAGTAIREADRAVARALERRNQP